MAINHLSSYYSFDGGRLLKRMLITLIFFSIISLFTYSRSNISSIPIKYLYYFWFSIIIISIIIGFLIIKYQKSKIKNNKMHYNFNIDKVFDLKRITIAILVGFFLGISNDLLKTFLPITGHPVYFIISIMAFIGLLINILWLLYYEKKHGPVYEINDYYSSVNITITQ